MAKSSPRRVAALRFRPFDLIGTDLNNIKCTLAVASAALGQAEDQCDQTLMVQSARVISACVRDLLRFEDDLDSWYVSHQHLPKEVARG